MGNFRGVTKNQKANTYRAVCSGKYLGCFTDAEVAALAVDDYRMRNGGKWDHLNFPARYPEPAAKKARHYAPAQRGANQDTRRLWKLHAGVRWNAVARNLPFNLTREDIVSCWTSQRGCCALTGRPMTLETGKGKIWNAVSVDRIDNCRGYEPDNIQLVCVGANRARMSLTLEEFVTFCQDVVNHFESKT